MRFLAHYISQEVDRFYYRTLWADSINEAVKIAKRWTRKGYRLHTVTQNE